MLCAGLTGSSPARAETLMEKTRNTFQIEQGDCLDLMAALPAGSIDFILCDPPYGITECRWDRKIPRAPFWRQCWRVLKERGAIALFAQQPFATELVAWSRRELRYEWIWDKGGCTGFANARRAPLRRHENILIFYRRQPEYHPQGLRPCKPRALGIRHSEVFHDTGREGYIQRWTGYPQSILSFRREQGAAACQKPVALLEYLIRTYTADRGLVLDCCMGTGSTGVATVNTGRRFVGFELDAARFQVANQRIIAASDVTRG
jgi:site-specific DNA-methyltransferase (adenine-specific)